MHWKMNFFWLFYIIISSFGMLKECLRILVNNTLIKMAQHNLWMDNFKIIFKQESLEMKGDENFFIIGVF